MDPAHPCSASGAHAPNRSRGAVPAAAPPCDDRGRCYCPLRHTSGGGVRPEPPSQRRPMTPAGSPQECASSAHERLRARRHDSNGADRTGRRARGGPPSWARAPVGARRSGAPPRPEREPDRAVRGRVRSARRAGSNAPVQRTRHHRDRRAGRPHAGLDAPSRARGPQGGVRTASSLAAIAASAVGCFVAGLLSLGLARCFS